MDITQLKDAVILCRDTGITSFVWGHRGLGKSSIHEQIARVRNWGFINMRCSQMEASDLRGLPDKEGGKTVYRPPADLPSGHAEGEVCPACYPVEADEDGVLTEVPKELYDRPEGEYCQGLLFLDELNRAEDDVLQAGFELVLDLKVGLYKVPSGWSVHCAGNFMEGYMVNNFGDPAFLDRFCHLNLVSSDEYFQAWSDYMNGFDAAPKILQFVGFNPEHLIGKVKGERGFSVQPSPRSWEFVAKLEEVCQVQDITAEAKRAVIAGIVGDSLAQQYESFTCEVTPRDIMGEGLTTKIKAKLGKLRRNAMVGLIWGLSSSVKNVKQTEKLMNNVIDFMELLAKTNERDLAVSLGRSLCGQESQELAGAMLSNPHLTKLAARWKKRHQPSKQKGPSWINLINEREALQELMSKVSYGME